MRSKATLAMLCVALLVGAPLAQPAVGAAPMLGRITVLGDATINGIVTPTGATLFSGDRVATETHAVVELLLNGGSKVLLPESSAVVLSNEAAQVIVNLKQGGLAVLSGPGTPAFVDANGARIKPAAHAAVVLEVAVAGNTLKVLAHRGSATVEAANKTLEVQEGKELDATMASDPPQTPSGMIPATRNRLETWLFYTALGTGITGLILGIIAVSRDNPADCRVLSASGKVTCP